MHLSMTKRPSAETPSSVLKIAGIESVFESVRRNSLELSPSGFDV